MWYEINTTHTFVRIPCDKLLYDWGYSSGDVDPQAWAEDTRKEWSAKDWRREGEQAAFRPRLGYDFDAGEITYKDLQDKN